jgi:peptidoglycan/xylan/chitin deacetylase (PgdA/CDA1 family)
MLLPIAIRCAAVAFALAHGTSPTPPSRAPARRVAVTFDDLPVVSRAFTSAGDHERITRAIVAAIRAHHIPAIGFVNEGKMYRNGVADSGEIALLRQWGRAGLELGNHTYSHLDLHLVPVADYLTDVARGDSLTRLVLAESGRRPRYFRHPFLHTGRSLEARAQVDSLLARRGYRVAPVTIDNGDYLFAAAYDAALGSRDSVEGRRIGRAYVDYMERVIAFYEGQSAQIVGREIPQVLLVHASLLNADYFGALATRMEQRGYAFATLDEVLADSAYRSADTYVGPAGITWLHRWALTRGMPGRTFAGEPEVPADIAAAAERAGAR